MDHCFARSLIVQSFLAAMIASLISSDCATAAEKIAIRTDTALAKLVEEASGHTPEMTIAAAGGSKVDIPRWSYRPKLVTAGIGKAAYRGGA
ncbi:hypothetical protein ACVWXM_005162 [Bradyrhizobium sp. GM7.3]